MNILQSNAMIKNHIRPIPNTLIYIKFVEEKTEKGNRDKNRNACHTEAKLNIYFTYLLKLILTRTFILSNAPNRTTVTCIHP